MKYLLLLTTLFFTAGCNSSTIGSTMRYEPEQLTNINFSKADNGYALSYSAPLESLYFSPGVKLIQKDGNTYIEVIRCKIDHDCDVDFKSTYAEDGSSKVVIDSDVSADNAFILGSDASMKL
jgi:hypothetical protein